MRDQSSQDPSSAVNRGFILEIVSLTAGGKDLVAEWHQFAPPTFEHFIEVDRLDDLPASNLGDFAALLVKYPQTLSELLVDDNLPFGHEVEQATDARWGFIKTTCDGFEFDLLLFTSKEDRDAALKAMDAISLMSEGKVKPVKVTVTRAKAPLDAL